MLLKEFFDKYDYLKQQLEFTIACDLADCLDNIVYYEDLLLCKRRSNDKTIDCKNRLNELYQEKSHLILLQEILENN